MSKFNKECEQILVEIGGGGTAFKKRSEAQIVVDQLNGYSKDGHFYVKKISKDYYQIAYKDKKLNEKYFDKIKIFDRVWVLPGEGNSAEVWSLGKQWNVSKKDGKLIGKTRGIDNKVKVEPLPKSILRPNVKKAISSAISESLDEDIKPYLAAGLLGTSAVFSGLNTDPPSHYITRRTFPRTMNKEKNKGMQLGNIKKYVEHVIRLERDPILLAIAKQESGLNPSAIGDKHLKNHAYGILQIRKPALIDVNETFKTNYTEEDLIPTNPKDKDEVDKAIKNSIDVYRKYLQRYRMSKKSAEEISKFWNGGPSYNKITKPQYISNINNYWKAVKTHL